MPITTLLNPIKLDYICFVPQAEAPQLSAIQKKLHPERQALTQEELKVLVDHDDLAKRVSALLDADKEASGMSKISLISWVGLCNTISPQELGYYCSNIENRVYVLFNR